MSSGRIQNLQVLRAVAALSVALFHTGLCVHGWSLKGSFRVPAFFSISGYMMARKSQYEGASLFFKRRAIRILPAYWVLTLAAFIVERFSPNFLDSDKPNLMELAKSLLFIPFVRPDGQMKPVLFVGWTLNYEVLVYFCVGLGILLFQKRAALFAIALIPILTLFHSRFFRNPTLLEFCGGVGIFYLAAKCSPQLCTRFKYLLLSSVLFCIPFLLFSEQLAGNRGVPTTLISAPIAFTLVLCCILLAKGGLDLQSACMSKLAESSYALYLIHPFVESIFRRGFDLRSSVVGALLSVGASAWVAVLLHKHLEKPFLRALSTGLLAPATPHIRLAGAPPIV